MTNEEYLERAKKIAIEAHKGQKRKNGEDYINHCIRVSNEALKYSYATAIVGMLHDVIEDTSITLDDLKSFGFPNGIIKAISLITKDKNDSYLTYILKLKMPNSLSSTDARLVKLLDVKDNLNGATGTLRDKYLMAYYILTGENIS